VREALASARNVIMRVDVQGAETVRKLAPDALLIFITTDNEDELVNRLNSARPKPPTRLRFALRRPAKNFSAWKLLITSSSITIFCSINRGYRARHH